MRKKLNVQCPCGYRFETFGNINDAIAKIKLHVKRCHKDFLPFGITNDEALTLINKRQKEIKPEISTRTAYSVQTESAYSFEDTTATLDCLLDRLLGEDIEVDRRTKRRKAQLIAL